MNCNLHYIPIDLHTNDNPIVDKFEIGEKLFYRCKPELLCKPYDNISLQDISHNRNFNDDSKFGSENVFYNIVESDDRIKYEDLQFIEFYIKNLSDKITYYKLLEYDNLIAVITLKHSPVPCMYPHCVFEIKINNVIVSSDNYNVILGKGNKTRSHLRSLIRQELTSIIQTGFIDLTEEIEILLEP